MRGERDHEERHTSKQRRGALAVEPPSGIVERERGEGDERGHEDRGGDERERCNLASAQLGAIA